MKRTLLIAPATVLFAICFAVATPKSETEFRKLIASYNHILEIEKSESQKLLVILNRSQVYSNWAQWLKTQRGSNEKIMVLLNNARKGLEFVLTNSENHQERRAHVHYLLGAVLIDEGKAPEAKAQFLKAISLDPRGSFAAAVFRFLGDDSFDRGDFAQAKSYYETGLPTMKGSVRYGAQQKLAMIDIQDKKYQSAFDRLNIVLAEMVGNNESDVSQKVVLQDLAVLSVKALTPEQIARYLQSAKHMKSEEKIFFVEKAIKNPRKVTQSDNSQLFQYWMDLEKRAPQRIEILLLAIQEQKNRAFDENLVGFFEKLRANSKSLRRFDRPVVQKAHGRELEIESQSFISYLVDVYRGLRPAPRRVSNEIAVATLKAQLNWHIDFFNESSTLPEMLQLAGEMCHKSKDWSCMRQRAEQILEKTDNSEMRDWAQLAQITALENLHKENNRKYERVLVHVMREYLEGATDQNWSRVAHKLSVLLVKLNEHQNAFELISEIDRRSLTEASYYRLQLARFEAKDFKGIVGDDGRPPAHMSPRVYQLISTSYLELATKSSDEKNTEDLVRYFQGYLKLEKNEQKREKAWGSLLARLEELGDDSRLATGLRDLDPKLQMHGQFADFARRAVVRAIEKNDFKVAVELLLTKNTLPEDLRRAKQLFEFALDPVRKFAGTTPGDQKSYFEGLLAVAYPDIYIRHSRQNQVSHLSKDKQATVLWALRLRACESEPHLNGEQKKLLKDVVPPSSQPRALAVLESYKALTESLRKKSAGMTDGQLARSINKVRALRSKIASSLDQLTLKDQITMTESVSAVELQTRDLVLKSKTPSGLTDEEVASYKKEIETLASEFANQANEIAKIKSTLKSQEQQLADASYHSVPVRPNLERWPWPESLSVRNPASDRPAKSVIQDLVRADYLQMTKKISVSEYMAHRAGTLLQSSQCPAMSRFVFNELTAHQQNQLIETWRQL